MRESAWRPLAVASLALLIGACTNGGKNVRDTTGMTPGAAAGQVGGASAPAAGAAPAPGDSSTIRRDSVAGTTPNMSPGMPHDSMGGRMRGMRRMMGDSGRRMMRGSMPGTMRDSAHRRP